MATSQRNKRWLAVLMCALCWSYGLVARFTDFFISPRFEKIILLAVAFLCCGLLAYFIFFDMLPLAVGTTQKQRWYFLFVFIALVVSFYGLFFYQTPIFPEFHSLRISPYTAGKTTPASHPIIIRSIERVEWRDKTKSTIAPDRMVLQGFQPLIDNSDSLEWNGDPNASILFERLMQAGIQIDFQSGPQYLQARVIWDGQESIVDLQNPEDDILQLVLEPKLNWQNTSREFQIMLILALVAELLGLGILVSVIIILLFPAFFGGRVQFRAAGIIVIGFGILLILFSLVPFFDRPVYFRDPQLESRVRTAINQPNGDIRLHKILTISELDASDAGIYSLDGIETLRNLSSLNLRGNFISDITPLQSLKRLRKLNLRDNNINDITPLAALTNLQLLNLGGNSRIQSISALANLSSLSSLNLRNINIGNQVTLLSHFTKLSSLNIRNTNVSDVSIIASLITSGALRDHLDIRDNPIPRQPGDGYALLRPAWQHIALRAPFSLPVFNTLPAPSFSHPGGFYKEPFYLSFSTSVSEAAIHYTMDGSEPTLDSPIYTQPILISNHTDQPNSLSAIDTTSPFWKPPQGDVFKAAVVRAALFHPDGSRSAAVTHTFFVNEDITSRYSLPLVSIVTDPAYLFDYDQGIYVMGRVWDETYDPAAYPDFWQPANYNQRGGEWERPVHIEVFKPDGQLFLAQDGGVRIHGGTTRSYPQKTLRLVADSQYDEVDMFIADLFPDTYDAINQLPITAFKSLLLRNSGNDWRSSMLRDGFVQSLVSHTSLDIQAYRPTIVFINGEYWGIHNLRERMDADFLASRYQISPDDVIILENYQTINQGTREDKQAFRDFYYSLGEQEINDPQFYEVVQSQMDIENFIDYQVAEIYSANSDWLTSNVRMWRFRTDSPQKDAPYGLDGRWRWMLFDTDMSFGMSPVDGSYDHDSLREAIHPTPEDRAWGGYMLRTLIGNSDFRRLFINRFADHLNTSFRSERVIAVLDDMQSAIADAMPDHIARWRTNDDSIDSWQQAINDMRLFAQERPDYLRQHIIDYFELPGVYRLSLQTDSTMGHIRVNAIDIVSGTPGVENPDTWSGLYFQGIPITLTAIPDSGFEFVGWEGIEEAEPQIQLRLNQDTSIKARFKPQDQ